MKTRYRQGFFGKLILQIGKECESGGNYDGLAYSEPVGTHIYWRDAKIEDLTENSLLENNDKVITEPKEKEEPWYGFDLDGTLAASEPGEFAGTVNIGTPIKKMIDVVKEYLSQGKKCKIMTARAHAAERDNNKEILIAIEKWCKEHIGQVLEITCVKNSSMKELWDDRAIAVCRNSGNGIKYDNQGGVIKY